ncbi:sensor histidine kinase [Paraburkholderia phenoliruptrix]|uniref:sensor histidine kinase n=1 Tax=Paraburkholderia phenoliruptrix TaxID=252970 RepID=UPI001C6F47B9|nr:HAMP domain-containing sensor histidine kinase [Paraburkholderia phenoliruptrix]MBW9102665.1 HAMP domain-containing histidine kinase [Paraburkholderia phenoliruptrix]MBW9128948.1 HAMP domain-containing histidine kinase [Paraburkholderia ginsengiterrae]
MIAHALDTRDTLLNRAEPVRASTGQLLQSFPVSTWVVCTLLASIGIYCAYVFEVAPWPVLVNVGFPLMLLVALASTVAVVTALKAVELASHLKQLAAAIEQGGTHGEEPVLSENGPADVARLARAINGSLRHRVGRQAELLQILAAYAHDQRTPLTRMNMRCELLEDAPLREALQRDLAEMADLVEASLSCAKMQCSAEEPSRRVDVDGMLRTLIGDYRDAGRHVQLDGCVGRPVVTSPHALRRVMMNLIDNALRYGGDARVCVRVEARCLVLAVVDSGPGIAPAQMDAVFAPWYRAAETAGRAPGSGLGLAIARRLVAAMGGDLQLENRRAGGLEARVTLPLVAA